MQVASARNVVILVDMAMIIPRVNPECDADVALAIGRIYKRIRRRSKTSTKIRLIRTHLDPALKRFEKLVPRSLRTYLSWHYHGSLAEYTSRCGFDQAYKGQRLLTRIYVKLQRSLPDSYEPLYITLESVLTFLDYCCFSSLKPSNLVDTAISANRRLEYCRFCGAPAEYKAFLNGDHSFKEEDPEDKLRLSNLYCSKHKPWLSEGNSNSLYRRALRSKASFDMDVFRLRMAIGEPLRDPWRDNEDLIEIFLRKYIQEHAIDLGDYASIREHARALTDQSMTDQKKVVCALLYLGENQSQISEHLGITRQAVSKIKKSIHPSYIYINNA